MKLVITFFIDEPENYNSVVFFEDEDDQDIQRIISATLIMSDFQSEFKDIEMAVGNCCRFRH